MSLTSKDTSENLPEASTPPLVMTKIRVPCRRSELLSRPRLVDLIYAHLDRKLILISAPAGYGKTSLLTDFAHDTDLPVCWYTPDPFDRDVRIFLEHLIAAIALQFPAFGKRSRAFLNRVADPGRELYPLVATLVQEIYDTITEYFVIILDDHHAVEKQEQINEFLDLLVTYADENCHFIIASRTLPALPSLSLLVARHQAVGLSSDELRFTSQEIKALARQNYDTELTLEEAKELEEQTEGWITGLLLTVSPRWEQAKGVALHGRIIVGLYSYLSKQVLDQQQDSLRDFLLASSVLDELSPELCTALLETDRSADQIEQLRTRNLFVVEFEGDGNRLRYHDLFQQFLQANLRRQDETRFHLLTRRAAELYTARGEWERAANRYLTLQDYDQVAEIIEQTATHMYETGRWDTLVSWIDALPEAVLAARPYFPVYRGEICAERGEHATALAAYDQARQVFTAADDKVGIASALTRKGHVLRVQGRYAEALAHCEEALALISGTMPQARSIMALAYRNMGLCYFILGRLAKGQEALQQASHLYQELDDSYHTGIVHRDLGMGYELAGDLEKAGTHYQAALQICQRLDNLELWANTLNSLGVIYYLQGQYDMALQLLTEGLTKARVAGHPRAEAAIWISLGNLHRDLGAYEQAMQAYNEGLQAATYANEGFLVTYALNSLGNTFRLQGNLAQARKRLLEALGYAESHDAPYEINLCYTSLGILASQEGDLAAARDQLNQAIKCFEEGGYKRELAQACLQQAQVDFLAGAYEEALAYLGRTLSLADQLGFDQFLVVDGQRLRPLLRYAAKQKMGGSFLLNLLDRIVAHQASAAKKVKQAIQTKTRQTLKIFALGPTRVELNGKIVQWPATQSRDLFFCLLQYPEGLDKEEIGGIFWPEHAPQRLDGIFRSTMYRLRRALFQGSVCFEEGRYRFNWRSDYWFDVEAFEKLLDQARQTRMFAKRKRIVLLEEALTLYRGDYLSGVYGDWCALEREKLRGRYLAALQELAGLHADRGELQRAIELYQSILAQDQYQEAAHQELMRCYYRQGDRAAAIRQYKTCAKVLCEELGLNPTPETEKLRLQIIS